MDNLPETTTPQAPHPVLDRLPLLRQAADRQGVECLDDTWKGHHTRYRFRCAQGHFFLRTMSCFSPGREIKCQQCYQQAKWNKLSSLAEQADVKCLDERWQGAKHAYRFECTQGHAWTRIGHRAMGDIGCPRCARYSVYQNWVSESWQRLNESVTRRGGQVLTDRADYVGTNHVYGFRCEAGHEWFTHGSHLIGGTWCPECASLRKAREYLDQDGLKRLQDKATEQGGQCLSSSYHGIARKYRFRCVRGHEWEMVGYRVVVGGWCRQCAIDRSRLTLDDAHASARARGGQCLSTHYTGCFEKLHWLCGSGHSWHATYASVRKGSWCPDCAYMAKTFSRKAKSLKRYKPFPV